MFFFLCEVHTLNYNAFLCVVKGGWRGDGLYVLRDNESAYVKRVRRVREGLEVMSDNPAYASWSCPLEELVVVGRALAAVRVH